MATTGPLRLLPRRLQPTSSSRTPMTISCRQCSRRPNPTTRSFTLHTSRRAEDCPPTQPMPPSKFTYHVAASFSAKNKAYSPSKDVFLFDPSNCIRPQTPRPKSERPTSGQDAFFITRLGDSDAVALGIADGVGGWEESGVDPADFSHGFCDYMAQAAHDYRPLAAATTKPTTTTPPSSTARALMQRGYENICSEASGVEAGGSTACVAVASEHGQLEVANLGDSGFVHLRRNAIHSYSEPQTHAFNTPYQLSVVPPRILARAAAFGGSQLCDYPSDSALTQRRLQHGDVLVFASDGLWDNVFNQDILRVASRLMIGSGAWKSSPDGICVADDLASFTTPTTAGPEGVAAALQSALAVEITRTAKLASMDRRIDGPFAKQVQKFYPHEPWRGGKTDDICVIVVVASEASRAQEAAAKL